MQLETPISMPPFQIAEPCGKVLVVASRQLVWPDEVDRRDAVVPTRCRMFAPQVLFPFLKAVIASEIIRSEASQKQLRGSEAHEDFAPPILHAFNRMSVEENAKSTT